jgi:hypothetical protein
MRITLVLLLIGCAMTVGCEPPTLSVEHDLPAAAPLEGSLRVGETEVVDKAPEGLDERFTRQVRLAVDKLDRSKTESATPIDIHPRLRVGVDDTRATRTVRRLADDGDLVTEELPSLHREVTMEAEFELMRGGAEVLTIELRRRYNSLADARLRGPLGLKRPDDPERVPAVETICDELSTPLARTFAELFEPMKVTVTIPLRSAETPAGRAGLDAAGRGDLEAALDRFREAVEAAPDSVAAHFNLAATAEALGRLDLARDRYERVNELTGEKDAEAYESARRVRRVLAHRKAARALHDRIGD